MSIEEMTAVVRMVRERGYALEEAISLVMGAEYTAYKELRVVLKELVTD